MLNRSILLQSINNVEVEVLQSNKLFTIKPIAEQLTCRINHFECLKNADEQKRWKKRATGSLLHTKQENKRKTNQIRLD